MAIQRYDVQRPTGSSKSAIGPCRIADLDRQEKFSISSTHGRRDGVREAQKEHNLTVDNATGSSYPKRAEWKPKFSKDQEVRESNLRLQSQTTLSG